MSDWKANPQTVIHLPPDGKVTGQFVASFQGDGHVWTHVDAHVNDDKPAVDYRGESYLASGHFYRQPDGTFTDHPPEGNGHTFSATRRASWSDAPRTYAAAIRDAMAEAVRQAWTPELDRAGTEADVAQQLHILEDQRADQLAKVAELDTQIAAQRARL